MFIYNVTIQVERQVEASWKQWMQEHHIEEVLDTGYFFDFRFLRLLNETPDADGVTYAVQYFSNTLEDINEYLQNHAPGLREDHQKRYGTQSVAFRTILEEVQKSR